MSTPEYKYFCPMRPPQMGAVPKDGLQYVESFRVRKYVHAVKRLAWGYAVYDRPLTAEEVADYELIAAPEEVPEEWRSRKARS